MKTTLKKNKIPAPVIRRLPRYYRYLEALQKRGIDRISSKALGVQTGLTASQIRQDLACFGGFGHQGYGYNVENLQNEIAEILGMNSGYTAIMVGAGRLGKALLANFPFGEYGITVKAIYDVDPALIGADLFGVPVYHVNELEEYLELYPVDIGILTSPAGTAHALADVLAKGGIKGIWNYTNVELHPCGATPVIEDVHLFDSLFSLCCRMNRDEDLFEQYENQA